MPESDSAGRYDTLNSWLPVWKTYGCAGVILRHRADAVRTEELALVEHRGEHAPQLRLVEHRGEQPSVFAARRRIVDERGELRTGTEEPAEPRHHLRVGVEQPALVGGDRA
jgi:hypothetical protein